MIPRPSKLLLACISGVIAGILVITYGFELVSVPMVKEYHELLWVITGLVLIFGCAAAFVFVVRKRPQKSAVSPPQ